MPTPPPQPPKEPPAATLAGDASAAVADLRRIAGAFEHSHDAVVASDVNGILQVWSSGAEELYGFRAQEVLGLPTLDLVDPAARPAARATFVRVLRGEPVPPYTRKLIRKDGQRVIVSIASFPIRGVHGDIVGVAGVARDITEQTRVAQALRASEERLGAILRTASDAIITADGAGVIQDVNPACERMFGYQPGELIGQSVKQLVSDVDRAGYDLVLAEYRRSGKGSIVSPPRELWGQRKDGTTFPIDLSVSEVVPGELLTGIVRDITRRRQLEREVLEISALEQGRIGRELHDGVGQELTGLSLLAAALADPSCGTREKPLLEKLAAGLDRVQNQLRALARGLIPVEIGPEQLASSLAELAARVQEQTALTCTLVVSGATEVRDSTVASHLFRIAQEAVHNSIRHSRARRIELALTGDEHGVRLLVRDDGHGIPADDMEAGGLGFALMRDRSGLIGGELTIDSRPGSGTTITCTVPRGAIHG